MHLTQDDLNAISGIIKQEIAPINTRLDNLENRFDNLENRFDNLENRFDNLENRVESIDNRLSEVEIKIDKLEADTKSLASGQNQIRKDIKRLEGKIDATYDLALDAWGISTENRTWIEEKANA